MDKTYRPLQEIVGSFIKTARYFINEKVMLASGEKKKNPKIPNYGLAW